MGQTSMAGSQQHGLDGDTDRSLIGGKTTSKKVGRETRAPSGLEGTLPQASSLPFCGIPHTSVHTAPLTLLGARHPLPPGPPQAGCCPIGPRA